MKDILAVILGGGQGTRLYPLTKIRAKPAVPIGGKFRLIDIPISNCLHWGIKKIFVLTQFNTESLHRHISNTYKFDGFSKGFLHILAAQQTIENKNWYQGTADAVRKNLNFIKNQDVDYVVILSGDQLYRINLNDFLKYHKGKKADITIASKQIPKALTQEFGLLKIDKNQQITDFIEKPGNEKLLDKFLLPSDDEKNGKGLDFIASMGIYIFKKDVLVKLLETNGKEDFGREVIPDAIKNQKVFSYLFDGYWEDIGTIKSFFMANLDFANPVPNFNFYDENNPIYTRARFLPGSKVKNCEMNQVLVCDGSILEGSKISQSIVGIRSVIREGSELDRVVMMGADFYEMEESKKKVKVGIGKNCFIKNAILDKNVHIGDNVIINYKSDKNNVSSEHFQVVDGIVVVQKNETIPDNTRIE